MADTETNKPTQITDRSRDRLAIKWLRGSFSVLYWLAGLALAAVGAHYIATSYGVAYATSVTSAAFGLALAAAAVLLMHYPKPVPGPWLVMVLSATLLVGFSAAMLVTTQRRPSPQLDPSAAAKAEHSSITSSPSGDGYLQQLLSIIGEDPRRLTLTTVAGHLAKGGTSKAIEALSNPASADEAAIFSLLLTYARHQQPARIALDDAIRLTPQDTRAEFAARLGHLFTEQWLATGSPAALELAVSAHEAGLDAADADTAPQRVVAFASAILRLAETNHGAKQLALLGRANALLTESLATPGLTVTQLRDLRLMHGIILRRLGQVRRDPEVLRVAVNSLQQALDQSEEALPQGVRGTILNELGLSERWLATLSEDESYLAAAVDHYLSARNDLLIAGNQHGAGIVSFNLLQALELFDNRTRPDIPFASHLAIVDSALAVTDRLSDPRTWSRLQISRGDLLLLSGSKNLDAARLQQAVDSLTEGLVGAQTDGRTPQEWALEQNQLANALQALGQARNDPNIIEGALKARRSAWVLYQYAGMGQYQFYFDDRIATLEQLHAQMTGVQPPALAAVPQSAAEVAEPVEP